MKANVFLLSLLAALMLHMGAKAQSVDTLRFDRYKDYITYVTHIFKDNHPELSFFKYRVFAYDSPINLYDVFTGGGNDSAISFNDYLALVNLLYISNYNEEGNVTLDSLENSLVRNLSARPHVTPISLSFIEYSKFKDSTIDMGLFGFADEQFTETLVNGYYPFQKDTLFASSALNEVFLNSPINFVVNDTFILSNIASQIDSISIDFADGNGFIPVVKGNTYSVSYNTDGLKKLQVNIKANGQNYTSFFTVIDSSHVNNSNNSRNGSSGGNQTDASCNLTLTPPDEINNIAEGNIKGQYGIWYSPCSVVSTGDPLHPWINVLRKPLIICSGFNPGNGLRLTQSGFNPSGQAGDYINMIFDAITINLPNSGWGGEWRGTLYEAYNGVLNKRFSPVEYNECSSADQGADNNDHFLDRLRDEGYDIIILTFDNGVDYIENNAVLVKKLIKEINAAKENNGYYFENIVLGYSAGAVGTRLALDEMEAEYSASGGNDPAHPHPHTKLWVSVEGEMQGCNVPIGFQHLLNYQSQTSNLISPLGLLMSGFSGAFTGEMILGAEADRINSIAAKLANTYNNNAIANELTLYKPGYPTGLTPERSGLMSVLASYPNNGYPGFCRRVGVSQGSSQAIKPQLHGSDMVLNNLVMGPAPAQALDYPPWCGTYTCYFPNVVKRLQARWWSHLTASNAPVFEGFTSYSGTRTIFGRVCGPLCHNCSDPCTTQVYVLINGISNSRPITGNNYDDVPGSTLASHIELGALPTYVAYNSGAFAGTGSQSYYDPTLHAFAPTVSVLDLHDPNNSYQPMDNFKSAAVDLNLMNTKPLNLVDHQEADLRYGFPHLSHPNDHYQITPFDGVYAIGENNGTQLDPAFNPNDGTHFIPRPDDQLHVQDAQRPISDFLVHVEIAPQDLYLSNRLVGSTLLNACSGNPGSCYTAAFEARNSIITGNGIYGLNNNQNYLTPDGDFGVSNNAKVILRAPDVSLLPGTSFGGGSGELDVVLEGYSCAAATDYRMANNGATKGGNSGPNHELIQNIPLAKNAIDAKKTSNIKVYPNPNKGNIIIEKDSDEPAEVVISDVTGKVIYNGIITNAGANAVNLTGVENGLYLLQINTNIKSEKFKIMVVQ